ncbi:MAG: SIMPL domain-containing protein [Candidatus Paceibacterota bacterium]
MALEEIKNNPLSQVIMIIVAVLLFVITFYFLVMINAKVKETQYIGGGQNNVISVSKTGTVYVKPDLAVVTITSTTDAATASDAISKNRDKSSAVLTFLKAQGVEDKYIKTVSYSVNPKYEYVSAISAIDYARPLNQKLVGYTATESLEVKIKQLDKIGDITTGAVTAGASNVSGLSFTVENIDAVKADARNQAIANAKADAQSIAKGLGVNLGKITGFTESGSYPYYAYDMAKSSGIGGGVPTAVPVATGESKIDVTVNITYEIK